MKRMAAFVLAGLMTGGSIGSAGAVGNITDDARTVSAKQVKEFILAQRRTCKAVSSCEEAVGLWCGGYSRADGDGDDVPCENVCSSRSQVDAIKAKIGC
jgi:hypothetical protein